MTFVAIKMGRRQGGPSRTGVWRAHPAPLFCSRGQTEQTRNQKVGRDVTDEQRSRRPIFIATLWAASSWLFFRVARSSRPAPVLRWRHGRRLVGFAKLVRDARRYCQSGSDRLEKQPTDPAAAGRKTCYFGDRTLTAWWRLLLSVADSIFALLNL
jgi:hypothetical protein